MKRILSVILLSAILICGCSCAKKAEPDVPEIAENNEPPTVRPVAATEPITDMGVDGDFDASFENFSANLLRLSYASSGGNTLISPLSVMLALALAVNGAEGDTKAQMINLFGTDDLDTFNQNVFSYVNSMKSRPGAKLGIANSAWFFDTVKQSYIDDITDLYNAQIFADMPKSQKTVKQINEWVREHTDGMIDRLFDDNYQISDETFAMLINAVCFDAEWMDKYNEYQVIKKEFTDITGKATEVDMMLSDEDEYIRLDNAVGFKKPYMGGYSFVALLPDEGVDLDSFVASLNGEKLSRVKEAEGDVIVHATLPKFAYDYDISLADVLKNLGMTDAFDAGLADFSKMCDGALYISDVMHKTHIKLNENGTKVAAVTAVIMSGSALMPEKKVYTVTLDRPFVYMIIAEKTSLPLFIGTVTEIKQ